MGMPAGWVQAWLTGKKTSRVRGYIPSLYVPWPGMRLAWQKGSTHSHAHRPRTQHLLQTPLGGGGVTMPRPDRATRADFCIPKMTNGEDKMFFISCLNEFFPFNGGALSAVRAQCNYLGVWLY